MLIIGIAGGTGSGKTTLVKQIVSQLPETEVGFISEDSYYKESRNLKSEKKTLINFDHPDAIDFDLLLKHILQLKNGKTINQPVYSYMKHDKTDEFIVVSPKKVLIVEGILIFTNPDLRALFDIKFFIQVDADERLIRRLKRDIAERNCTMEEVLTRYQTSLKPMHQQFIEPTKTFADMIIPNDKLNTIAVDFIRTAINQRIS